MKYTFIILFTILSVPAFSQQPIPSLKSFQFQANGIILFNVSSNLPYDTVSFSWSIPLVNGTPDSSGITHFYFVSDNRTLGLSIDAQQHLITSLIYTYHKSVDDPPRTSRYLHDSSLVLSNVSYTSQEDTIHIEMDSAELAHCIMSATGSIDWIYLRGGEEHHVYESKYNGLAPGAYFQCYLVGMHTESSSLVPQYYVLPLHTDTTGQKYGPDSVSINYLNNFTDTIVIKKIEFTDPFASVMNITYGDGSSLLSPKIILPNEKHQKFSLRITSKEGPHQQSRTIPFTLTKKIGDSLYTENFSIEIPTKTIDYESQIWTDHSYNVLYMDCEPGDTVFGTIHIYYSNMIRNIHFDAIPDSTGFQLVGVQHLLNEKVTEFRYISSQEGLFQYWYPIEYVAQNFDGSLQQFTSSASIVLTSYVSSHSGVDQTQEKGTFSVFPNPANGNISLSLKGHSEDPIDISLYDMLGNTVQKERIQPQNSTISFKLNEGIADGVYFIIARGNKIFSKERLIVLRH